ncbi:MULTISPECIES: hypothetical protein [Cyanophyceae]|nr:MULTISPECIES: hypothetical protein [Cyanophyceae]MBD1918843.1 hypothetical protein [Phormidium sp. FACHB-77]MBD2053753.1 hypothetical protein [Leptolyngbya sp. FACHB-60]
MANGDSFLNVGCTFAFKEIAGFGEAPSATYSVTITIVQYQGSTQFEVPYEAWISPAPDGVFAIVKHAEELFFDCGTEGEIEEFEFTDLALLNQLGVGASFSNGGDAVITRPSNWRVESEDFLLVTAQPPTDKVCVDEYLGSRIDALAEDKIYRIDLAQLIDGQTLQARLQTSANTVTANLSARTATSGESVCELGEETVATVQVPSPGRGTVEGITYLP